MMKPNLFAAQERIVTLTKLGDAPQVTEWLVDFAALAAAVDEVAPRPSRERCGRPQFPTEIEVRILLIQQLLNLSDEKMIFQLLDSLSFQRFAGLRDSGQIPDRATIWILKERLIKADASESVFDAVNRQLARHGYIAYGGQIVGASIVQVPIHSLTKDEKAMVVGDNAISADRSPPKRRQKDLDARCTRKYGKFYFGYKLSVGADKRCKLISRIKVNTASQHGTLHFDAVLDLANTSRDLYANKGCINLQREQRLTNTDWRMHIQRRGSKDKPLCGAQERRNRRIASPRSHVELVFASMAQLGGKVLCSIGLTRAARHLHCKEETHKPRRLCYVRGATILAFKCIHDPAPRRQELRASPAAT